MLKQYGICLSHSYRLSSYALSYMANYQRKRLIHIGVKETPNIQSRIFFPEGIPSNPYSAPSSPLWFPSSDLCDYEKSPLAFTLFKIDGVLKIMLNDMNITITKCDDIPWKTLQPHIILTLNKALSQGIPFQTITDCSTHTDNSEINKNSMDAFNFELNQSPNPSLLLHSNQDEMLSDQDSTLEEMIQDVLETRVRPIVEEDGGYIELKQFDNETGIVWICLSGACDGCPSASITVKDHVESMLQYFFEEVKEVRIWTKQ